MKRRLSIKAAPGAVVKVGDPDDPWGGLGDYRIEGEFEYEVEDIYSYVQVALAGRIRSRFTYRDPSGQLRVADLVEVPFGYDNLPQIARVVELGRGSYSGLTKDVAARLDRTPL